MTNPNFHGPYSFDTKLYGLGLRVSFYAYPPEPEIGLFAEQIEFSEIAVRRSSGLYATAPWFEHKLSPSDWETLTQEARQNKD
jgi:hypothetical protein